MLEIHGVPISVHTRKVIVAAIEKSLPYRIEPVIPFNPPPGWEALSPTGKIPVIKDGDLSLADSSVICNYLERLQPEPPLFPSGTPEYIHALWLEEYADGTVFHEVVHPLFFQTFIRPNILKQETEHAVVEATLSQSLPRVFSYLDSQLGDRYAVGSRFSVADVAIVSNLLNFQYLGYEVDGDLYPGVVAHFQKAVRHPSILAAVKAEQAVATQMNLRREFLSSIL